MSRRSERVFRKVVLPTKALTFFLIGEEGATSFYLANMPVELVGEFEWPEMVTLDGGLYLGTDVGRHHRLPVPGFSRMENCPAFDGVECWYDGSGLTAMALARQWKAAGMDEGVIRHALEAVYEQEFGDD